MKQISITASDGFLLSALFGRPVGEACGTIILSSATAIKKEFYVNFARFLIQNGYNVLLYDYRGVGESIPDGIKSVTSSMHDWGLLDMNAALDYLVKEKNLTNIIWLGHSVGAQLIGFVKNTRHIKKVIAVNAALGYWKYMPFPQRVSIWMLWFLISPLLVKIYGYGTMQKVGWGENLPKNIFMEWRGWCMNRNYYMDSLKEILNMERFYNFRVPYIALYTSDDYIANDKTVPLMTEFFPNAPMQIIKLQTHLFSSHKVGHSNIFRKRFNNDLWPELMRIIEGN